MNERAQRRLNLVLLQLGAAVPLLLGSMGRHSLATIVAWSAALAALIVSRRRGLDLRLWLVGAVVGTLGEWAAAATGAMTFTHPLAGMPVPGWLTPSWALLGTATAYVLRPLRSRPALGWLVGAAVGGLALFGAVSAGQIAVTSRAHGVGIALWLGTLVWGLLAVADRIDPPSAPSD